jgi:AcrR family transcriptional regulator
MISTKSNTSPAGAEPVRRNGHERFAAILDAAVALFGVQGFGATAMSDIASQSHTAAGSLYRFFPTKEAVGDAVVLRYVERFEAAFGPLLEKASSLSPGEIALAATRLMHALESDHAAAINVADSGGITTALQLAHTGRVLDIIGQILTRAFPQLKADDIPVRAFALMQLFKTYTITSRNPMAPAREAVGQVRLVIELYLHSFS